MTVEQFEENRQGKSFHDVKTMLRHIKAKKIYIPETPEIMKLLGYIRKTCISLKTSFNDNRKPEEIYLDTMERFVPSCDKVEKHAADFFDNDIPSNIWTTTIAKSWLIDPKTRNDIQNITGEIPYKTLELSLEIDNGQINSYKNHDLLAQSRFISLIGFVQDLENIELEINAYGKPSAHNELVNNYKRYLDYEIIPKNSEIEGDISFMWGLLANKLHVELPIIPRKEHLLILV